MADDLRYLQRCIPALMTVSWWILFVYILSIKVCDRSVILVSLDIHGKKELARNIFNKDEVCG